MFAQLSRVFDEGGASGMLLSVLHAQPGGQIVFDSSDVTIAGADARCRGKGNNLGYFDMTTLRRTFWDLGADTASLELCPALPKLYVSGSKHFFFSFLPFLAVLCWIPILTSDYAIIDHI